MQIVNDCVVENTLFLKVNGTCRNVSQVIKDMEKCCLIVNRKIDSIENKVKILEDKLTKCCNKKVVVIKDPRITYTKETFFISISYQMYSNTGVPYNFRNLEYLKRHPNTDWFGPNNTKYYSDKEKEALVQNIRRVNPTYGKQYITSSNGTKYYLE